MPTLCVSSPYIAKHLGGGEKYLLDIATQAKALGWTVSVAIPADVTDSQLHQIQENLEVFLGKTLSDLSFVAAPWLLNGSIIEKWRKTSQFDAFFWITDGSVFLSGAKRNILHFQIPFTTTPSFFTKLKLANWPIRTANSDFTRKHIEQSWGIRLTCTHAPLIEPVTTSPTEIKSKKQKRILNVGRFFRQLHSKRQDVLVEAFKQLQNKEAKLMKGWKLVLVGSVEDEAYFQQIVENAKGLDVEFKVNLSRLELENEYRSASLYWHAAGYQVDSDRMPQNVEHFGISTVEAMSAGCIPLVVPLGGQAMVVGSKLLLLSWSSISELVGQTIRVISETENQTTWRQAAYTQASLFGEVPFRKILANLLREQL